MFYEGEEGGSWWEVRCVIPGKLRVICETTCSTSNNLWRSNEGVGRSEEGMEGSVVES